MCRKLCLLYQELKKAVIPADRRTGNNVRAGNTQTDSRCLGNEANYRGIKNKRRYNPPQIIAINHETKRKCVVKKRKKVLR